MKNKVPILFILALLISFVGYLLFENASYKRQIGERDQLLHRLLLKDSIASSLLKIEETDSMIVYSYVTDDEGNKLSYQEAVQLMRHYEKEVDIKDMIILDAKRLYKFDYSVQQLGDTIRLKFWKKIKDK